VGKLLTNNVVAEGC